MGVISFLLYLGKSKFVLHIAADRRMIQYFFQVILIYIIFMRILEWDLFLETNLIGRKAGHVPTLLAYHLLFDRFIYYLQMLERTKQSQLENRFSTW